LKKDQDIPAPLPPPGKGEDGRRPSTWRRTLVLGVGVLFFVPVFLPVNMVWRATRPLVHKDIIDVYAGAAGFDPVFVMALVRVESGFSPLARSRRGAMGLMQIMPVTAREMALRLGLEPDRIVLDDPAMNIRLGVKYLEVLRQEFGGDRVALLAAYNAGPKKAREWRRGGRLSPEAISFPETKIFVQRVLATERWIRRLQRVKGFFHA
jgi:soluble lytic murein transglycosylase